MPLALTDRKTDSQTQDIGFVDVVGIQESPDGGCDVGQDLLAAACGDCGDLPLFQHIAGLIKIGDLDGGAAKVNAKAVFHGVCPPERFSDAFIIHNLRKNTREKMKK